MPISDEKFTDRARKVVALANQEAQRFNHENIGTEHLLLGLLKEGNGLAAKIIQDFGFDLRQVCIDTEKFIRAGPDVVTVNRLPFTPAANKVLHEFAPDEARAFGHNHVGTEHILLGLIRASDGVAALVLAKFGLKLEEVREAVRVAVANHCAARPQDKNQQQLTEQLTTKNELLGIALEAIHNERAKEHRFLGVWFKPGDKNQRCVKGFDTPEDAKTYFFGIGIPQSCYLVFDQEALKVIWID